jgi:hypothetical protein
MTTYNDTILYNFDIPYNGSEGQSGVSRLARSLQEGLIPNVLIDYKKKTRLQQEVMLKALAEYYFKY